MRSKPAAASISPSCSDFSIEVVPTSMGCMVALAVLDLLDDGLQLLGRRAVHLVVLVLAGHRAVGRDLDHLELVDLGELVRLGRGRAGHAGELLVEAEIVLEGDGGQRHVLGLDLDAFLGLQRLMQPFRIAAARHHAAGELVDDDDLAVADDVVLVAREQLVGLQRLLDVMDQRGIGGLVERALGQQPRLAEHRLDMLVAGLGEVGGALLLVDLEVGSFTRRGMNLSMEL